MKKILLAGLFLSFISCKYKENKATYTIIEEDTIAIDKNVLQPSEDSLNRNSVDVTRTEFE
ncbi:MAG TPA: hypothetical protein VIG94_10900 [Faecalibacter sp.]